MLVLFNLLRQMKRWLHQHIFKLGWLLTRDFRITTILYYTFFLPGIVLYELVFWLVAGILDVRAERAISIPEEQDIGELRLGFVRLSRKAPPYKVTFITISPFFVGLIVIWFIASNIFDIRAITTILSRNAGIRLVSDTVEYGLSVPDFWLWFYVLFTVSNTMVPDVQIVKNWWWLVGVAGLMCLLLLLLGAGEIIANVLSGPVALGLNALSAVFALVVVVDLLVVVILGSAEAVVERFTGYTATFKNGKMIVMTREEASNFRRQERAKEKERQERQQKVTGTFTSQGTPSVYRLLLPIPGLPGQEPITQMSAAILDAGEGRPARAIRPSRIQPTIIPGEATSPPEIRINLPLGTNTGEDEVNNANMETGQPGVTVSNNDELIYEEPEDSV